jgi:predicted Holliday junction resolvase-like endonuclease
MTVIYAVIIIIINLLALFAYRKLGLLRSISQIQAEVELEMHSRAHKLLVQRDQLEVGLVKDAVDEADEKWKGDLAEYMEEFEQEALLRSKKRLNRV